MSCGPSTAARPHRVGTGFGALLDLLDELAIAENTIVVFAGDSGPDEVLLWRGTLGSWEGSPFAGSKGNLRTPRIVRWPGHTRVGEISDEIMYVTDWFTTLLHAAGFSEPDDRVIDGIDQLDWLTGASATSWHDGYDDWMGPEIYGVKWRNFRLVLVAQKYSTDPAAHAPLATHHQPHDRPARTLPYIYGWTVTHFKKLVGAFRASVQREPLIPAGAPLDHVPTPPTP
jgi:arylsulfatase A-like enzyme